jgi:hypothetical protein
MLVAWDFLSKCSLVFIVRRNDAYCNNALFARKSQVGCAHGITLLMTIHRCVDRVLCGVVSGIIW